MGQLFHYDSPFVSFTNKVIDMVFLNFLFLIGCIPLVTIGAAQTALYTSLRQHFSYDAPIFSTFWKAYLANIGQSIILWLLSVCIHLLGVGGIIYYAHIGASPFLLVLQVAVYLLWIATESWLFPLHARFSNTVKNTVYNAFCCAISGIAQTLCAIILKAIPVLLLLFTPSAFIYLLPFFFTLWFSLSSWLILKLYRRKILSLEQLAEGQESK